MADADDLFAQELERLRGFAKTLYRRHQAAFGWSDFGPDDLFQETVVRIVEKTEPAGEDGRRVTVRDREPVSFGFYIGVMRNVVLEMAKKSRLNRQLPSGEGDKMEDPLDALEDHAPLPDQEFEIAELRLLVLQERMKLPDDRCFTEIIRKIVYEGYSTGEAIDDTIREMGGSAERTRATYFRWFSKIKLRINKLH